MTNPTIAVPRELLERSAQMIQFYVEYLCATNSEESDIELAGECVDELRALLTAQPQASAAQSAPAGGLWAVHAQGPDDLYAAFSREDAERHASELNAILAPEGVRVSAVVIQSPWSPAEHWQYLAEQEREHCDELMASWQRTQSAWVPEGWKLVPEQPTDSMVQAVIDSGYYATPATAWPILVEEYKAMLAAAPAQPAAQDQGEVRRLLKDYRALLVARRFPDNDEGDFGARIRDQELRRIDAALAASTGQEV